MRKLAPAHVMVVERERTSTRRYWAPPPLASRAPAPAEAAEALGAALRGAVRRRLRSDVPVGIFASGGVDSGVVSALVAELSPRPLPHFCMGFVPDAFDERRAARVTARHVGAELAELVADGPEIRDACERLVDVIDEPLADASIVPYHLLARHARQRVTVVLGGDGADELLAGYPTYPLQRWMDRYEHIPASLHRVLARAVAAWPPAFGNYDIGFGLRRFLAGRGRAPGERLAVWMSYLTPEELGRLRPAGTPDAALEPVRRVLVDAGLGGLSPVEQSLALNLALYLPDSILAKVDRASMRHGLEVRAPFLDRAVADLTLRWPASVKLDGLGGKRPLRALARRYLPPAVARRRKRGFTPPVAHWLRGPLVDLACELLGPSSRLVEDGLIDGAVVRGWLDDHRSGRADRWRALWALLVLEQWRRAWGWEVVDARS